MLARRTMYWLCQIAGWSAAGGMNLMWILAQDELLPEAGKFVITFAAGAALAIAWTHGYRAAIRRRRWVQLGLPRLLPRVLVACLVLAVAITASVTPVWMIVFGGGIEPLGQWA